MSQKNKFVLDRIEGTIGVFENEDGGRVCFPLPEGAKEGDIFVMTESGLTFMQELTSAKRECMKSRLSRLFSKI